MKRWGPCSVVLLASFSLLAVACNAWAAESAYTFSINGQPVTPQHYSLNGDPSVFAPGDVIYLGDKEFDYGGLFMTLGEEETAGSSQHQPGAMRQAAAVRPRDAPPGTAACFWSFRTADARSWASRSVGQSSSPNEQTPSQSQGAKKQPSSDRIPYNPLDSLSPEEIHGLWGIEFVQWPKGIEQELAHVDPNRVCLTVHDGAGPGGQPGSSGAGRYFRRYRRRLAIWSWRKRAARACAISPPLASFAIWSFSSSGRSPANPWMPAGSAQNASLRCLDLSGCGVSNYQKLASLTELRF